MFVDTRSALARAALAIAALAGFMTGAGAQTPGQRVPAQLDAQVTTAELMQRQAGAGPVQIRPEHEVENPDRHALPQDADAAALAQWPVPSSSTMAIPTPTIHTTALAFNGATLADTGAFPPDSMGTVGPTQFVVFVNGRIRSFNKSGAADGVLNIAPDVFFASAMTPVGGAVVRNFTSDPQIRYDRFSARWFLTIIDVPCTDSACTGTVANRVLIAVSNAASNGSISAGTVWTFFHFVADPGGDFLDYPSLGIDVNALYIGGNMFTGSGSYVGTNGYVVRKSSVLGSGPIVVNRFANLASGGGNGPFSPRGVDNLDAGATQGYFIGVDNAVFGRLVLRRVSNPGTSSPSISSNINVTVNTTTSPNPVEHAGNNAGSDGYLDSLDDRLYAAVLRNGTLWTAHNFRVSSSGVASTSSSARNASRWYQLQNLSSSPSVLQSGTVYDNVATRSAARQYFIPSISVTGQGHAVIGFTTAGVVGATPAYTGRLASDAAGSMSGSPGSGMTSFGTTTSNYNPPADPGGASGRRWGDYSLTSVDPLDEMTVWTIQQYNQASNSYAVRVARLNAPPPATPTCSSAPVTFTGPTGNVVINATSSAGSGFFDPGSDLPSPARAYAHLTASVSNATVNSTTFNSPTQVTLNITASSPGLRNVTLTNPDGQSVTANGCINVLAPGADLSISNSDGVSAVTTGGNLTYTISATNAGPLAANGALVNDSFPADLSCNWTCSGANGTCPAVGSGNLVNVSVNLPVGASVTFLARCSVAAVSANTSLVNTASITPPAGTTDPNTANNSATDSDALIRLVNLSISKTDGSDVAIPGTPIGYQIVVGNAGPNAATTRTTDAFPLALGQCQWTCLASAGSCTPSGTGNISDVGSIEAGGSLSYQATCVVSATASGTLGNTASVAVNDSSQQDPSPADDSATDSDTLVPTGDLVLGLSDDRDFVALGDSLDYRITITNPGGPSTLKATLTDSLPAALGNGSWICQPSFGAVCAGGNGNVLQDNISIPKNGQVSYVYSATVIGEDANGRIDNAASVVVTGGGSDPNPANNAALDSNVVVIYRNGFEDDGMRALRGLDDTLGPARARVLLDSELIESIGIMPTRVLDARGTDGTHLFDLELARFGDNAFARGVVRDRAGLSERGPWLRLDAGAQAVAFAWQAATPTLANGSLDLWTADTAAHIGMRPQAVPLSVVHGISVDDQVLLELVPY